MRRRQWITGRNGPAAATSAFVRPSCRWYNSAVAHQFAQSHVSDREFAMSSVEDRISALESEIAAVKRQLAAIAKPRPWLDEVAGSMDPWPEFEEVLRLGREFRRSAADVLDDDAAGD